MTSTTLTPLSAHLRTLKERSGLSLEGIASKSGYKGKSSVQRYFETDDIVYISQQVAQRLAAAFYGEGEPPISVSDLAPLINDRITNKHSLPLETIAEMLNLKPNFDFEAEYEFTDSRPNGVPVVGMAYASSWMEATPSLDVPQEWLFSHNATPGEYASDYALKILGHSVNRVARDGSFAICRRYDLALHLSMDGKFVHVQRTRRGLKEWTIKKVKWTNNEPLLFPDSDHPDHQLPISFGDEDVVVDILGFVLGWYIPAP